MRILLLADTHLGFDSPRRPRVRRRRRGPDFFRCYEQALEPARRGAVDLVVHGGDLLFRARVGPELVQRALAPLLRVADAGVPVVLVPGNHERSRLPFPLLGLHPNLHVFHRPWTFRIGPAAVSGFPFARRVDFPRLLERTGWRGHEAGIRLLCMHQTVEGARVEGFTFRRGPDVVPRRALPVGFDAVLCGHIHRHQVLTRGLAAPVFYPGSVERTSFQERNETKGYLLLDVEPGAVRWTFVPLPARPMLVVDRVERLRECDPDAVVRVDAPVSAVALRALAPPTMTVHAGRSRTA